MGITPPVITRSVTIDDITPQELATVFAGMWADEQADFFEHVGFLAKDWPGAGWCQQSSQIALKLNDLGRETIAKLAEWAADPEGLNA